MKQINLYDFQSASVEALRNNIRDGIKNQILSAATGSGKTVIATYLLEECCAKEKKAIFVADRINLIDQTSAMLDSYGIPHGVIQAQHWRFRPSERIQVASAATLEKRSWPDDTDLIIVDECHRGGANDESNWRDILEYFASAVQIGLTATPKRKDNVDTYKYFGDPKFIYKLKDGIEDGFLTPFRVRKYTTNIDEYVYDPEDDVLEGDIEAGEEYTDGDWNTKIEIRQREEYLVDLFMKNIGTNEKTIVFCANQNHAALIRDIINEKKAAAALLAQAAAGRPAVPIPASVAEAERPLP
jgi:type I restriction enzyme R subunit